MPTENNVITPVEEPEIKPAPQAALPPVPQNASRLNALKHHLTSKVMIAPEDEMEAYREHCKAYMEALHPVGIVEIDLAQEVMDARFRLKRIVSIEQSTFAQGHLDHSGNFNSGHSVVDAALAEGATWASQAKSLALLSLYAQRIRRQLEKASAELAAIQKSRKQAYQSAQEEAIRLLKLSLAEKETIDISTHFQPAPDHGNFVFSISQVTHEIARRTVSDRAAERFPTRAKAA